ncbi:MAG TPA: DUF4328 domain-containing protein [Nitrososphaeraceae archaeon]|nr:DUF4328 domain-containing protein [Nitrososphaeraceae archaeon]
MTISSTSFRSISNLTDWLVKFSIAMIILSIISVAASSYQAVSVEYDPQSDNIYAVIGIFTGIISILLGIILLFWYYRATKNIHSFGAKEVTSPRMAVIWWFIPIAVLWKPYQVTQQIWKASNPEIKLINGTEWKNTPNSKLVKLWWFLTLASIFGSIAISLGSGVLLYNSNQDLFRESIQATLLQSIVTIPFLILGIISTIYFIRVIKQISTWQYQKSIGLV